MGLSQSDIQRIAGFVRKVTKAASEEAIITETVQLLKTITRIKRLRVVYSRAPGSWTEWNSAENTIEVRSHEESPEPELVIHSTQTVVRDVHPT